MTAATGPVRHILCFYGVEDKNTRSVGQKQKEKDFLLQSLY